MNSNKRHKKAGISGNGDCRVVFCPDCGALEINLGASTIRTDYEPLLGMGRRSPITDTRPTLSSVLQSRS